jgi:RNA ligase (TIGR02306 family)
MEAIAVGDSVLGVDVDGRVTATTVTETFNNGPATDGWLRITGKRRGAGRGSHFFALRCTPDHRVWSPSRREYVEASTLVPGDSVSLLRTDLGLTPVQEQVLLGKMLGDGSLHSTEWSSHVAWGHRVEDDEYSRWTARGLGELASDNAVYRESGYGSKTVVRYTVNSAWIKDRFASFFSASREKQVPEWVSDALTPLAIAFWYMDDGSLGANHDQEDRSHFAVCAFDRPSCDVLIRGLAKFGIAAVYYEHDGYSRLRLNADDAERLFLIVAPYVPPCMQRKLPERYRGHSGWLPNQDSVYRSAMVDQVIETVSSDPAVESLRYDMTTGTHNYFAHGVLVHNCNARFVHDGTRLHAGSRTRFKKLDSETTWANVARKYELESKLERYSGIAIYGETYGNNTDMAYGVNRAKDGDALVLFDALDTKTRRWFDVDEFLAFAIELGLPVVPTLDRGPFDYDAAVKLAEGPTTMRGATHVREGIVVKPVRERVSRSLGRVFLKLAGQGYLLRKGA